LYLEERRHRQLLLRCPGPVRPRPGAEPVPEIRVFPATEQQMEARRIRALRAVGEGDRREPDRRPALRYNRVRWRHLHVPQIAWHAIRQRAGSTSSSRTGAARPWVVCLVALWALGLVRPAHSAMGSTDPAIHLQISPRICTLTEKDKECATPVHAQWQSA